MSHLRFLALASLLSAAAPALSARADLQIQLGGTPPAPAPGPVAEAVAKRTAPKKGAAPAPVLGSRHQIGVARRGSAPPILPPADGSIPAEVELPAIPSPEPARQIQVNARLGKMLAPMTDVYRMPDPRSQWVGKLKLDTQVAIVSQWQGWYAIVMGDGSQAYVPMTHVEVLPYQVRTVTQAPAPAPPPQPVLPPQLQQTSSQSSLSQVVLQEAYRYMGAPYVWGGNGMSGIDCSGLVKNCFEVAGVKLPRKGGDQAEIGQDVPFDQLQPGDRLYFSVSRTNDHTGIYIGDGRFIHAGKGRGNVGIDTLEGMYKRSLTSARRL